MRKNVSAVYVKGLTVLGDEIIYETSTFLLKQICKEEDIDIDITPFGFVAPREYIESLLSFNKKLKELWSYVYYKLQYRNINFRCLDSFANNLIFLCKFLYWVKLYIDNKALRDYYDSITKNADIVFFSGGGLFQQFYMNMWSGIFTVVQNCKKKNIPVYFNAIGIEKPENFVEKLLYKYILNQKIVKVITVRENQNLVNSMLNSDKECIQVVDSALFADECYGVSKNDSEIIGIGAIRAEIFMDNGCGVTKNEVLNLYSNIIKELDKRGYKWQIFTNGGKKDYRFAQELVKYMNVSPQKLAKYSENSIELMNTIKSYKAIIAARLHSLILATSINIPSVGIVWAPKSIHFAKYLKLGTPITPDMFCQTSYIIDELEKAIENGVDICHKQELKLHTCDVLRKNLIQLLGK